MRQHELCKLKTFFSDYELISKKKRDGKIKNDFFRAMQNLRTALYVSVIKKVLKLWNSQEIKHLPRAPSAMIKTPVYSHDEFWREYRLLLRRWPPVIGSKISCSVVDGRPAGTTGFAALFAHRTTVAEQSTVTITRGHHPHQPLQDRSITRTSAQVPCNSQIAG